MDGPIIESRWGRDFLDSSTPTAGTNQSPAQWVPGLFSVVKWREKGNDDHSLSSAEVKERV